MELVDRDNKILVSGCDIDGIARGKILNSSKFKHIENGFGFCNVIFGWDCHDAVYEPKTPGMINDPGFADILAKVDLSTFRRCPLSGTPHYVVEFFNPLTQQPLPYCPRSLLRKSLSIMPEYTCLTGVEFEFFNYKETSDSLHAKKGTNLTPLTTGMFGYSLARPAVYQDYFDEIYNGALAFKIPLECYHTETGPGVYEAAIEYADTLELCDRAHLFKLLTKKIGAKHGIIPCFMAKPYSDQPGCSGHLHFSLKKGADGKNAFSDPKDPQLISDTLRHFLAGVLKGLPSIMAILAPTVNSYKRLNIAYWAPVTVSYGFESRTSAIRIITPPVCSSAATRIEVRVPGADVNCYLACAAITACGYYGIQNKLALPEMKPAMECEMLPSSLQKAVDVMAAPGSMARLTLGDEFVDHYAATRRHELRLWNLAVTDWELKRYMEVV